MKAPVIAMMLSLGLCAPALAATFVYVSNADDGDIGIYTLQPDGSLQAGPSGRKSGDADGGEPGKRFLSRRRAQAVPGLHLRDRQEVGAVYLVGKGPLAESYPYITIDATGRYLLSASYDGTRLA